MKRLHKIMTGRRFEITINKRRYLWFDDNLMQEEISANKEGNSDTEQPHEGFHGTYAASLFDPKWKLKRQIILNRDGNSCVICGSNEVLQVHHRQYHFDKSAGIFKQPWEYEDNLLITLCQICHKKGHRNFKVPIVYF